MSKIRIFHDLQWPDYLLCRVADTQRQNAGKSFNVQLYISEWGNFREVASGSGGVVWSTLRGNKFPRTVEPGIWDASARLKRYKTSNKEEHLKKQGADIVFFILSFCIDWSR